MSFVMLPTEEVLRTEGAMRELKEQVNNMRRCYEELSQERQQWRLSAIALFQFWESTVEKHGEGVDDVISATEAHCIGTDPEMRPWFSEEEVAVAEQPLRVDDDDDTFSNEL